MYEDKRTILPNGLLSRKTTPAYTPKPIRVTLPRADKPAADHINIDKEKAYQASIQQQQLAMQQQANNKSGKIICTRYYELGWMDKDIYHADQTYGAIMVRCRPEFMVWYWAHAPWFVKRLHMQTKASRLFAKVLWQFVKPWSSEMAYRVGVLDKGSLFGSFLMLSGDIAFNIMRKFRRYEIAQ